MQNQLAVGTVIGTVQDVVYGKNKYGKAHIDYSISVTQQKGKKQVTDLYKVRLSSDNIKEGISLIGKGTDVEAVFRLSAFDGRVFLNAISIKAVQTQEV